MTDSYDNRKRIMLHVDMAHFFSAVEDCEHPEIRCKPVVVSADPKEGFGRGVVKTCNFLARGFRGPLGHADFDGLETSLFL